jgi:hypothetical protein
MLPSLALDVRAALARAESDRYSNLVTRATGRAVRGQLELVLGGLAGERLAVLDFSQVGVLDFSCADEIVAQLLLRHGAGRGDDTPAPGCYFACRGLHEAHLEALDPVLEHHELAIVAATTDGTTHLLGTVCDEQRAAWRLVEASGGGDVAALAAQAARPVDALAPWLTRLATRRVVVATAHGYWPLRVG